ncbi:hypothetical protein [Bradyrhizobium sp. Ai1a-2]|nr:hypothetical protein [Bradyrhizobium sp. Ai1a-2]
MITSAIIATIVGVFAGAVGFNRVAFSALGLAIISLAWRYLP